MTMTPEDCTGPLIMAPRGGAEASNKLESTADICLQG